MHADRFEPLPADKLARWEPFPRTGGQTWFPALVGLEVEEIRRDYCRMRLPFRPELNQPAGVVHGGAVATLIDTVVVPAIAGIYDEQPWMVTLTMDIQYLGALDGQDAIGEGWVEKRGRSIVFCRAEVTTPTGEPVAHGTLVYKVSPPR